MAKYSAEFLMICLFSIFFHGPEYFNRSVLIYLSCSSCLETCWISVSSVFRSARWYEVHNE